MSVYEPSDDSFLLLDCVKNELDAMQQSSDQPLAVCDMGAGSGYIGFFLLDKNINLTSIDINEEAIKYMQEQNKDVTIIHSDLFKNVPKQTFDIITFNTPYLPNDEEVHDVALHGGEKGNEVALEFLKQAKHYINEDSIILMLVSSLGQPQEIEEYLNQHSFDFKIVGKKKLFFEELLVYKITRLHELHLSKEELTNLQNLIPKDCTDISVLAKGKRGVVFKAKYQNKTVVIKVLHPSSDAKNALLFEAKNLETVNKLGVGPQLISSSEDYVMMEFVEGQLIGEFLEDADEDTAMTVFDKMLKQLKTLDEHNLNKFEMTNPYKHIIVKENLEPVLIDFERMRFSTRPKNVNQFKEYIRKYNS